MHRYFIGISVSELQQWLADDVLPVLTGRITYIKNHSGTALSLAAPDSLFVTLPAFAQDDPAGVLVAEVGGPGSWGEDEDPGIRRLPLSGVLRFIPLTEDAGKALTLHLAGMITLSPAMFEHGFTYFRIGRKSAAANRAGNLFANLLIDHGPAEFTAGSALAGSLPRALMAAEHRKPDDIAEFFGQQAGDFAETWVGRVFGDTRPARNNQPVNLKDMSPSRRGLYVLGVLMAGTETVKEQTGEIRTVWKGLEKTDVGPPSLAVVYGDPTLSRLEMCLDVDQQGSARVSVVTLALFLHWKFAYHDQRSTVDVPSILKDVKSLVGLVKPEQVANALWMMGAYLGMEHVAPSYRYLHREKYPALLFAGKEEGLDSVPVWQLRHAAPLPAHQPGAASIHGARAAGMPTPESAPADNADGSGALQPKQQVIKDGWEATQMESIQKHVADDAGPAASQSPRDEAAARDPAVVIPGEPQTAGAGQALQTEDATDKISGQAEQSAQALPVAGGPVTSGAGMPAAAWPGALDADAPLSAVPSLSEGDRADGDVQSPQTGAKAARSGKKSSKKAAAPRSSGKGRKTSVTLEAPVAPAAVERIGHADPVKPEVRPEEAGTGAPEEAFQDDFFQTRSGAQNACPVPADDPVSRHDA